MTEEQDGEIAFDLPGLGIHAKYTSEGNSLIMKTLRQAMDLDWDVPPILFMWRMHESEGVEPHMCPAFAAPLDQGGLASPEDIDDFTRTAPAVPHSCAPILAAGVMREAWVGGRERPPGDTRTAQQADAEQDFKIGDHPDDREARILTIVFAGGGVSHGMYVRGMPGPAQLPDDEKLFVDSHQPDVAALTRLLHKANTGEWIGD